MKVQEMKPHATEEEIKSYFWGFKFSIKWVSPKDIKIKYVHLTYYGKKFATLAFIESENSIWAGLSICRAGENFCRKEGRGWARDNLLEAVKSNDCSRPIKRWKGKKGKKISPPYIHKLIEINNAYLPPMLISGFYSIPCFSMYYTTIARKAKPIAHPLFYFMMENK